MERQRPIPPPTAHITRKLASESKGHNTLMNFYSNLSRDETGAPVKWKMSSPIHINEESIAKGKLGSAVAKMSRSSSPALSRVSRSGSNSRESSSEGRSRSKLNAEAVASKLLSSAKKGSVNKGQNTVQKKTGKKTVVSSKLTKRTSIFHSRGQILGASGKTGNVTSKSERKVVHKAKVNLDSSIDFQESNSIAKTNSNHVRKRGRPPKPESKEKAVETSTVKRKRGRPKSLNLTKKPDSSVAVSDDNFKSPDPLTPNELIVRRKGRPKNTPPVLTPETLTDIEDISLFEVPSKSFFDDGETNSVLETRPGVSVLEKWKNDDGKLKICEEPIEKSYETEDIHDTMNSNMSENVSPAKAEIGVNTDDISDDAVSNPSPTKRKAGRPPGSKNKPKPWKHLIVQQNRHKQNYYSRQVMKNKPAELKKHVRDAEEVPTAFGRDSRIPVGLELHSKGVHAGGKRTLLKTKKVLKSCSSRTNTNSISHLPMNDLRRKLQNKLKERLSRKRPVTCIAERSDTSLPAMSQDASMVSATTSAQDLDACFLKVSDLSTAVEQKRLAKGNRKKKSQLNSEGMVFEKTDYKSDAAEQSFKMSDVKTKSMKTRSSQDGSVKPKRKRTLSGEFDLLDEKQLRKGISKSTDNKMDLVNLSSGSDDTEGKTEKKLLTDAMSVGGSSSDFSSGQDNVKVNQQQIQKRKPGRKKGVVYGTPLNPGKQRLRLLKQSPFLHTKRRKRRALLAKRRFVKLEVKNEECTSLTQQVLNTIKHPVSDSVEETHLSKSETAPPISGSLSLETVSQSENHISRYVVDDTIISETKNTDILSSVTSSNKSSEFPTIVSGPSVLPAKPTSNVSETQKSGQPENHKEEVGIAKATFRDMGNIFEVFTTKIMPTVVHECDSKGEGQLEAAESDDVKVNAEHTTSYVEGNLDHLPLGNCNQDEDMDNCSALKSEEKLNSSENDVAQIIECILTLVCKQVLEQTKEEPQIEMTDNMSAAKDTLETWLESENPKVCSAEQPQMDLTSPVSCANISDVVNPPVESQNTVMEDTFVVQESSVNISNPQDEENTDQKSDQNVLQESTRSQNLSTSSDKNESVCCVVSLCDVPAKGQIEVQQNAEFKSRFISLETNPGVSDDVQMKSEETASKPVDVRDGQENELHANTEAKDEVDSPEPVGRELAEKLNTEESQLDTNLPLVAPEVKTPRNRRKEKKTIIRSPVRKFELRQKISRSPLDNIAMKRSIEDNSYLLELAKKKAKRPNAGGDEGKEEFHSSNVSSEVDSDMQSDSSPCKKSSTEELLKECKPCAVVLTDFIKQLRIAQCKESGTGDGEKELVKQADSEKTEKDLDKFLSSGKQNDEARNLQNKETRPDLETHTTSSSEVKEIESNASFVVSEHINEDNAVKRTVPPLKIKVKSGYSSRRKTYMVESCVTDETRAEEDKSVSDCQKHKSHGSHKKRVKSPFAQEKHGKRHKHHIEEPESKQLKLDETAVPASESCSNDTVSGGSSDSEREQSVFHAQSNISQCKVYKVDNDGRITVCASGSTETTTSTMYGGTVATPNISVRKTGDQSGGGQGSCGLQTLPASFTNEQEHVVRTDRSSLQKSSESVIISVVVPREIKDNSARFCCNHCHFSTDDQEVILAHTKSKHSHDTQHACIYCEEVFRHVDGVVSHFQAVHPGKEIMYRCGPDFYDRQTDQVLPDKGNIFDRMSDLLGNGENKGIQSKTSAEADSTTEILDSEAVLKPEKEEELQGSKTEKPIASSKPLMGPLDTIPSDSFASESWENEETSSELNLKILDVYSLKDKVAEEPTSLQQASDHKVASSSGLEKQIVASALVGDARALQGAGGGKSLTPSAGALTARRRPTTLSGKLGNTFKCDKCNVHTPMLASMVVHLRNTHTEIPRLFQCPYCRDMEGETEAQIHQHIKKFHPTNNPNPPVALSEMAKKNLKTLSIPIAEHKAGDSTVIEKDIYMCLKCKTHMPSLEMIYDHLEQEHHEVFVYVCPYCKVFKAKDEDVVNNHIQVDHKRNTADIMLSVAIEDNQFIRVPSLLKEKNSRTSNKSQQQSQPNSKPPPSYQSHIEQAKAKALQSTGFQQSPNSSGAREIQSVSRPPASLQGAKRRKANLSETINNLQMQKQMQSSALGLTGGSHSHAVSLANTSSVQQPTSFQTAYASDAVTQQVSFGSQQPSGPPPLIRGPPPLIRCDQLPTSHISVTPATVSNQMSAEQTVVTSDPMRSVAFPMTDRLQRKGGITANQQVVSSTQKLPKPIQSSLFDTSDPESFNLVQRKSVGPVLNVPVIPKPSQTSTGSPLDLSKATMMDQSPVPCQQVNKSPTPAPSLKQPEENPEAFKIFNLRPSAPQQVRPGTTSTLAYRPAAPMIMQQQQVGSPLQGFIPVNLTGVQSRFTNVQQMALVRMGAPSTYAVPRMQAAAAVRPVDSSHNIGQPQRTPLQQSPQTLNFTPMFKCPYCPKIVTLTIGEVSPHIEKYHPGSSIVFRPVNP